MKFAKLTAVNGLTVHVNPNAVTNIRVFSHKTTIYFIGAKDNAVAVKESGDAVVDALMLADAR